MQIHSAGGCSRHINNRSVSLVVAGLSKIPHLRVFARFDLRRIVYASLKLLKQKTSSLPCMLDLVTLDP